MTLAKYQTIWLQRVQPKEASELLRQYRSAFKDAGCRQCSAPCCNYCGTNYGYLLRDGFTEEELLKWMDLYDFNPAAGFHSPTGCKIPAEKRSTTCVTFWCGSGSPVNGLFLHDVKTPGNQLPTQTKERVASLVAQFRQRLSKRTK